MKKLRQDMIRKIPALFICLAIFYGSAVSADDRQDSDLLKYIRGPINAEDILPLGDTEWLITSGLNGQFSNSDDTGHIYLVNRNNKTFEELFPGAEPEYKHDIEKFNACPGPINPENFSAHGLALKQLSSNRFHLYITSHGAREAIEVFDINTAHSRPAISWTGCVPLPEKMLANSVAILSDGGFVATKFFDPTLPNAFNDIFQGKKTGGVYEWHPGGKVSAIPGTDLSGANGIEISPDNKYVYVTATGTREIVRYDRTEKIVNLKKVQINISPDNIHWGDDGLLYTAGGNSTDEGGWSVFSINPVTLKTNRITGVDQTATIRNASVATPVGNEIWIGTYSGDSIGYLPKPQKKE